MKDFNDFAIENADLVYGGDLEATYVGANGDYYDTEKKRYILY